MHHEIMLLDYATHSEVLFVKLQVFDAVHQQKTIDLFRISGGEIYGDAIHPKKTHYSEACRLHVLRYLTDKIERQAFF